MEEDKDMQKYNEIKQKLNSKERVIEEFKSEDEKFVND